MNDSRILSRLKARLERAELELLRTVCAEQAARIEALEAELDEARREAAWADQRADMFHDLANAMQDEKEHAPQIGITRSGRLFLLPAAN